MGDTCYFKLLVRYSVHCTVTVHSVNNILYSVRTVYSYRLHMSLMWTCQVFYFTCSVQYRYFVLNTLYTYCTYCTYVHCYRLHMSWVRNGCRRVVCRGGDKKTVEEDHLFQFGRLIQVTPPQQLNTGLRKVHFRSISHCLDMV